MDFSLAEERRLLQDSISRYLGREYAFDARRKHAASPEGFSREAWNQFAELGLLGLTISDADGGMGGTPFDTMIVMEAFGRALVVEPYVATVVLGAGILSDAGSPAQKEQWLPAVATGEKLLAFAHSEAAARYDTRHVEARAKKDGAGWKLDGAKAVVLNGGSADALIVSARTSGDAGDERGISLFLVDPKAKGVTVRAYPTQDGSRAADVKLNGVAVGADALIGHADDALPVIERALDRGCAALCAEALGVIDALNAATLEYLKTRKQFGQPIGRFQALQHRMVEMTIRAVEARSMAIVAASGITQTDARERSRLVSAAKAYVGQCSRFVGQQAIQLHGAIGVTDELIVSHWFKRLTMINATFGDADHHLARVSDLMLSERE
ncbi:acyl-CoA dehydrogenase family protein [Usitatibacter palustris]|uniref:Acyl-CoA dehydrogenase, short-chain specific n=1 Tax=Usitatibacter palustris TaxID=2732487 RepID=A0A6M4H4E9_9PROT|nr:acyl-CoA dehydrogenase [Usitatibacter palustris]QJR13364.1 Acyl-CoA dehydrogenase, short-chain specific [Usitatibacter palustris]